MAEKTRYSDAELEEFRAIILEKLELAQRDYELLKASLTGADGNDTDDTSPTYKVLEEGANTLSKEETTRLAQRQLKFIQGLQAALVRIENKTYGICRETGKLIPAERLRAVPHATLSIEIEMGNFFTKSRIALLVIFSVLIIDQIIKVWIKTHMYWHESIRVTDWFYIYFTENNGMAFGMEILGKLFLTSFRIVAVTIIGWFLYKFVKQGVKTGFIICISLILTGALGNIIDSVFYGVLFNESTHSQIASFLPEGGGYASLFYGKVVDMFYFPIIDTNWPQWLPFIGGQHFIFFSPIFNFADAAISCGIISLLLFYSKYLNEVFHTVTPNLTKIGKNGIKIGITCIALGWLIGYIFNDIKLFVDMLMQGCILILIGITVYIIGKIKKNKK